MSNILSLERFRGLKLLSSCSDVIHSHSAYTSLGTGVCMLILGLLSFALGVAAICVSASASYIGYGIWCGLMFVVTGIIFMATMCSRNACLITTMMVSGLISFFLSVVQFSLGILATNVDSDRKSIVVRWGIGGYVYDLFNSRNVFDGNLCSGNKSYNFENAWAPVNILLILSAFVTMVCSMIGVIVAAKSLFCGVRRFKDYNEAVQRGYLNSAYDNHINQPPMYKINE